MLAQIKTRILHGLNIRSLLIGRLRRHDAQILQLQSMVEGLLHDQKKDDSAGSNRGETGLRAVLLNAASNQETIDQVANAYEALALRVANLEKELDAYKRGAVRPHLKS